jgi:carbon-monoxide dehydrogenase small subunit
VNGRKIQALVEPRTHLADFLREHCRLTGTHLGCEHGVCGACTVLIDDEPARSCLTYAVQCDGLAVQTIEGFDADPIMQELRTAFSREHGLQCGFCTSGMLIAARDIVQRLPDADARRIRVELSGNLCRCTGYLGIINAVESVIAARRNPRPSRRRLLPRRRLRFKPSRRPGKSRPPRWPRQHPRSKRHARGGRGSRRVLWWRDRRRRCGRSLRTFQLWSPASTGPS